MSSLINYLFKNLIFNRSSIDRKMPNRLKKSFELGQNYNKDNAFDHKKCYKHYPMCMYSAKTMLKLIQFNNYLFG